MTEGPWDAGLQNERTGLAWQRTLLSGLTCSLLVARLLATVSLTLALALGLLALLCTTGLGALAVHRFRRQGVALYAGQPLDDGRSHALLAALTISTALGALLYITVA
jgi:uncharacterized membrane protein YidH (DUF202 family)